MNPIPVWGVQDGQWDAHPDLRGLGQSLRALLVSGYPTQAARGTRIGGHRKQALVDTVTVYTLVALFHTTALLQAWEHSFRGVANAIFFVVFSKLLKLGEEGLGFTGDWRVTVQGPCNPIIAQVWPEAPAALRHCRLLGEGHFGLR